MFIYISLLHYDFGFNILYCEKKKWRILIRRFDDISVTKLLKGEDVGTGGWKNAVRLRLTLNLSNWDHFNSVCVNLRERWKFCPSFDVACRYSVCGGRCKNSRFASTNFREQASRSSDIWKRNDERDQPNEIENHSIRDEFYLDTLKRP